MTCYGIDMDKNERVTVVLEISNLLFNHLDHLRTSCQQVKHRNVS